MKSFSALLVSLMVFLFTACAPKTLPSSNRTGDYNAYNEDLSEARPVYNNMGTRPGATTKTGSASSTGSASAESRKITNVGSAEALHINRKVDEQLTSIADKNRSLRYASGYRIQVYVGNERQQAEAAKLQVYQSFPELTAYLSYNQPTYKLKIGDFIRRMDAERYFGQIKQMMPSAMLQPDKIDVRRSLSIK
ncbi:SPOR domain-containing protein [Rudanella paleaurantiibacter]|uniref:SPOR domain-containing protein n=1 Tax=Rudanella paleaurantiibacter TaxID=2614655 RepID=UPI00162546A2|nr:SPOR domain-containing protein [Rudanella paleaurantiibacter]